MEKIIAHIDEKTSREQSLCDHSVGVAKLAESFANQFNNGDWAYAAGLLHDLGKAFPDWQEYIRGKKQSSNLNHSEAGAQFAFHEIGINGVFSKVISYLIAGHHAGLPDFYPGIGNDLQAILSKKDYLGLMNTACIGSMLDVKQPKSFPLGKNDIRRDNPKELQEHIHLWIRMLYSCLVDADFLNTESFVNSEKSELRKSHLSINELKERFDKYMAEKTKKADSSYINTIRSSVLASCREKAKMPPGFFSLNVPTGGGKTLSSMAFALDHALAYGKKRVIMAIPYTSIIEQTAKVYKYGTDDEEEIIRNKKEGKFLFGEDNVLEHHCNFVINEKDDSINTEKVRLATENWDMPIVVTTNVQLFESLFSAYSSSCRKLHNLVDSVIILDEVQMLPPEYLMSIVSILKGLVNCFGVTVLFCTATQPALTGRIGSGVASFEGIPNTMITPIIEDPRALSEQLVRVCVDTTLVRKKISDWQELADRLCQFEQVLCIVQTRKDCRNLHSLMPAGTIHLSALMCAEERSEVIAEIKEKLKKGEEVRVISTQLIECGVDIDFPVVFKAIAGLDSIAQSAGRCNRNGRLTKGKVFVFESPTTNPPGLLRKGADATRELLELSNYEVSLSPEAYERYFRMYYSSINDFDKPSFKDNILKENRDLTFQFRTLSDKYHLIDDTFQNQVFVRYVSKRTGTDNIGLIDQLVVGDLDKTLFRQLSRYSVSLPLREIEQLLKAGRIYQPMDGVYVQSPADSTLYQPGVGLMAESMQSFSTFIF